MVSRRNYFAITAVMFIVFFMFQFTNAVLEGWDGYEENSYVRKKEELAGRGSAYEAGSEEKEPVSGNSREKIIYIGDADKAESMVVRNWVNYTKRELEVYPTAAEYAEARGQDSPDMLVVDAKYIDWEQEDASDILKQCVEQGTDLVFCNLPEASVIEKNQKLRVLLGIRDVREEETTVEGIYLYDGFLLGGETVYQTEDEEEAKKRQDMNLSFPWYSLSGNTEAYMLGIPEKEMDVKDYPPVIWKKSYDNAQVFAVNGDYMEDVTGLGLLSAMEAKSTGYELYPVVNAQNMIMKSYPGMASENEEEMKKRYGQSMSEMFRNIAWPSVISVYRRSTLGLTCMLAPRYDYESNTLPSQSEFEFYMKRLKEQSAEAGLSGDSISDTLIGQKLDEDENFVGNALPDYKFTSFYAGGLTSEELDATLQDTMLNAIRTVVTDYDKDSEIIGYQSDYVTKQSILSDGIHHTYRTDFRIRAVETALGYSSVGLDLSRAAYPKSSEDDIEKIISDFNTNINISWDNFHAFSGTTASECDQRIRNFLALDYTEKREGNTISLDFTDAVTPAWFILRTDGERISRIEGGDFTMLEENAYLIEADNSHVVIEL